MRKLFLLSLISVKIPLRFFFPHACSVANVFDTIRSNFLLAKPFFIPNFLSSHGDRVSLFPPNPLGETLSAVSRPG